MMGDATVEELMNLVEGYAALMKQAERGDATEAQCDEIWSAIRRIATMLESASAKKAKRLEDALRGMIEAHLLEDYSNSGHYLDLCGQAWMKARDVLGEECNGVVTSNADVTGLAPTQETK